MRSRGSKPDAPKSPARLAPRVSASGEGETASGRLGAAVRARRKALRLSQAELCDLSAVGLAFLYELEHGKPTVRLDKVLAVLSVLGLELHLREGKLALSAADGLVEARGSSASTKSAASDP